MPGQSQGQLRYILELVPVVYPRPAGSLYGFALTVEYRTPRRTCTSYVRLLASVSRPVVVDLLLES